MDEMYRMLGREHEADLEREARKWQRAAEVGLKGAIIRVTPQAASARDGRRRRFAIAR
jgi:hypothetical protein